MFCRVTYHPKLERPHQNALKIVFIHDASYKKHSGLLDAEIYTKIQIFYFQNIFPVYVMDLVHGFF